MDKKLFLADKKLAALVSLSDGNSVVDTSINIGVTPPTIYNWIHGDKNFSRVLNQRIVSIVNLKLLLSIPHVETAINTIVEVMTDENNKPSVRLQAARELLDVTKEISAFSTNAQIIELREQLGLEAENES